MSSEEIAISVRDVTKHYVMFQRPEDRLKQMIVPRLQRLAGRPSSRYFRDFAALSNVSFDVRRGETIGIVGRNGSGKSTLLQIICGTLQPTAGTVQVNGRIAALLELGAGFNTEFTGRENVYLNATIQGLSQAEIDARFDSIAAFADIGQFIDQPVKTYSSGMYVRLAFATAINVDPEILVVDEALAVGDEAFQRKCFARIEEIKEKGGTILFVSHAAQSIVQLCDRALLIDGGEKIMDGRPKMVVNQYQRLVNASSERAAEIRAQLKAMGTENVGDAINIKERLPQKNAGPKNQKFDDRAEFDPSLVAHSRTEYDSEGALIINPRITTTDGRNVNLLLSGKRYIYRYSVEFHATLHDVGFGMLIKTINGIELGGATTGLTSDLLLTRAEAGSSYEVQFDLQWSLAPGTYFLNAGVTASSESGYLYAHRLLDAIAFRILPIKDPVATAYVDFDPIPSYCRTLPNHT